MLNPDHNGEQCRVRMMCWDTLATRTMTVVSSEEAAQKLVDKYSEQYPHAYFDYVYSL